MIKRINKKKIAGICPVGIKKTLCPSIRKIRQTRVQLLAIQKEKNRDIREITKLQSTLKEMKNRGIAGDCDSCSFNTSASAPVSAAQ